MDSLLKQERLLSLGHCDLELAEDFERFQKWLADSKHAGMQFLEKYDDIRRDPKRLLPEAKSAHVIGLPYDQGDLWPMEEKESPRVAQYARFKDYHKLFKEKVENVFRKLSERDTQLIYRVCVDTAPLLERALAAKAGAGFIGKNTCYIHESHGSLLLLAIVLTNHALEEKKEAVQKGCNTCTLCQVACPTGALNQDYTIDSRKCLSYWTIEHRGEIPFEFWPHLAKYYFGCDICQVVCPYNIEARESRLSEKIETRSYPELPAIALMSEPEYEKYFGGTPMTRAKRNGLRRNAIIAMTVTKHPKLKAVFEALIAETDPILLKTIQTAKSYSL